jgi:hypothetical protein
MERRPPASRFLSRWEAGAVWRPVQGIIAEALGHGQNCLRNLSYYLDKHRPDEEELAEWGSAGEDHLFLSETRQPLTKMGMEMLFKRLKKKAGLAGKRISPHILRHTFAINYLVKSNDPFSLQELLGHEDLATVQNYMHMNDETIQAQKRKYSPGDHLPTRMPGPRETRRKRLQPKEQHRKRWTKKSWSSSETENKRTQPGTEAPLHDEQNDMTTGIQWRLWVLYLFQ